MQSVPKPTASAVIPPASPNLRQPVRTNYKRWLFEYLRDPVNVRKLYRPAAYARLSSPLASSLLTQPYCVRYLRLPEVLAISGHAESTLYRLMKKQLFPRPVEIGPNSVGWREQDIAAWSNSRKPRNKVKRHKAGGE